MAIPRRYRHGQWPNQGVFILAAAGACIGLGNLWRFPALAMEYGGGAFILAYLGALLLLGIPVALAEAALGRGSRHDPVGAYREVALLHGQRPFWLAGGWLAMAAAFLLLVLLAVTTAWGMGYLFRTMTGALMQLDVVDAAALFRELSMDPERVLFWITLFLAAVMTVVSQGFNRGLVPVTLVLVPLLIISLLVLLVMVTGRAGFAVAFQQLFALDWYRLGQEGVLRAFQHAFFTLAVGTGVFIAYGAAIQERVPIVSAVTLVAVLDLLAALAAGLVVATLAPGFAAGPGLAFEILPTVFAAVDGGMLAASAFYLTVVLAGVTSGLALAEALVASVSAEAGLRRGQAGFLVGVALWLLATLVVLFHTSPWAAYPGEGLSTQAVLEAVSGWVVPLVLALAGLSAVLVAGWGTAPEAVRHALHLDDRRWVFLACHTVIRWLAPVLLLMVVAFTITDLSLR